jgi:hypothetical protein
MYVVNLFDHYLQKEHSDCVCANPDKQILLTSLLVLVFQ